MARKTDILPGLGLKTLAPRLVGGVSLARLRLTPNEAYVISRLDGKTTLWEVCLLVPLDRELTLDIMRWLRQEGFIEVPGSTEPLSQVQRREAQSPPRPAAPASPPAASPPVVGAAPASPPVASPPVLSTAPVSPPRVQTPVPTFAPARVSPPAALTPPRGVTPPPAATTSRPPYVPPGAGTVPMGPRSLESSSDPSADLSAAASPLDLAELLDDDGPAAAPANESRGAPAALLLEDAQWRPAGSQSGAAAPGGRTESGPGASARSSPPLSLSSADDSLQLELGSAASPAPLELATESPLSQGAAALASEPAVALSLESAAVPPLDAPAGDAPARSGGSSAYYYDEPAYQRGGRSASHGSASLSALDEVLRAAPMPDMTPAPASISVAVVVADDRGEDPPLPPLVIETDVDIDAQSFISVSSMLGPDGLPLAPDDEVARAPREAPIGTSATPPPRSPESGARVLPFLREPPRAPAPQVEVLLRSHKGAVMTDDTRSRRPHSGSTRNPLTAGAAPPAGERPPSGRRNTATAPAEAAAERSGLSDSAALRLSPAAANAPGKGLGPLSFSAVNPEANPAAADAGPLEISAEQCQRIDLLYNRINAIDAFTLLGVTPSDDKRTLQRAYFRLSKEFHPDRFFKKRIGVYGQRVAAIFQAITEARDTLVDDERRAAYLASGGPSA